ncbi:MAG: TRAP transporter substrate-binding protein, partial [Candidatus Accumulibacter sp.]|nr:TRAP transporter substrate-binding protein [Accumulibacter sp.]
MKRRVLLLSALAVLGAATLPAYAADKIVIKIAGMKPDGEPETVGMRLFAKYVMEASKGKYDVQIFPNSQLGKEDAYIAQTRKGIIQMCATGTQTSSLFPAMAMLETPMLYDSLDHAHRAMNGETFKLINKGFAEKSGLTLINAFPLGFRHFYTKKPINSIDDLKGLRMRVPNIPLYLEFAKQLGQSGQPMPFAEVPAALDQGTIDGGDSPFADIVALKMYEITPNITLSGHILVIHGLYINNDFYNGLSPEDRKIFDDAAYRSAEDVWKMAADVEKKAIEEITK